MVEQREAGLGLDAPLGYRPGLDGLRAVAVAVVIGYHYADQGRPFAGGFLGVYLFFVLSGFLITRLLVQERVSTGRVGFGAFYRRRVARLFPGYALFAFVVLGASLFGVYLYGNSSTVPTGFLTSMTYSTNWYVATHTLASTQPFAALWSLSVEEQFYFLWPATLLVLLRFAKPSTVTRVVFAGAALAFVQVAIRSFIWPQSILQIVGTDCQPMGCLLIGCAVALTCSYAPGATIRRLEALVIQYWRAALFVLVPFLVVYDEDPGTLFYERGVLALLACAMAVLMLASMLDTPLRRALSTPLAVYIGRRSYELYLWHLVVGYEMERVLARLGFRPNLLVSGLLSAAVSVVVAEATYRFVGRPLRAAIMRRRRVLAAASA